MPIQRTLDTRINLTPALYLAVYAFYDLFCVTQIRFRRSVQHFILFQDCFA